MKLHYKGYDGSAEVSVEDGVLHGKVLNIRDLITYEAESIGELKAAFEAAVDDYLLDCSDEGREADKPFKGSFNVRLSPDLHRELSMCASAQSRSLNDYVGLILLEHRSLFQGKLKAMATQRVLSLYVGNGAQEVFFVGQGDVLPVREVEEKKRQPEIRELWTGASIGQQYAKH